MPPKNSLQKIQPENPSKHRAKSRVPMWQGWKPLNMPFWEAIIIPKNWKFPQLAVLHLFAFQNPCEENKKQGKKKKNKERKDGAILAQPLKSLGKTEKKKTLDKKQRVPWKERKQGNQQKEGKEDQGKTCLNFPKPVVIRSDAETHKCAQKSPRQDLPLILWILSCTV